MATTSASLLGRLRDGSDPDAWGRVLELYGPLIRGWVERLGVRGTDTDDLVQDVLAGGVRPGPRVVPPPPPRAVRGGPRGLPPDRAPDLLRAQPAHPRPPRP